MNCQTVGQEEIAEKHLRGELPEHLQDEFEVHILECEGCLHQVETLDAIRATLIDRAHDIRTRSAQPAFRFRFWSVVTATAVIALAGLGAVEWFKGHHQTGEQAVAQQPAAPKENPAAVRVDAQPPSEPQQPPAKRSVTAAIPKAAQGTGSVAHQPDGELTKTGPEPSVVPNPSPGAPAEEQTAKVEQSPPRGNATKVQAATLSNAQALELYKLAAVDAPPYAFAGIASGKRPQMVPSTGATASGSSLSGGRELFQKAMVAYVEGRYREAKDLLEGAAEAEPKAPDVNFYLGVCRLLLGHPDDSIQPLKKVIDARSPLLQSAHYYLGKTYLQKADLKQAEAELQAASEIPGRLQTASTLLLERVRNLRSALEMAHEPSTPPR